MDMVRRGFVFVVLTLLALPVSTARAEESAETLRVMTFNIRFGTANDGENRWDRRKDFVVETIEAFDPDLLGTQETLAFQRDYLVENLQGYATFGVGRDDGREKGEMMSLFYKTERFEKLDGGHFWYSETPQVAGSKSWDSSLPRLCSWVKLKDRQVEGKELYFFNTHFDHRGRTARVESARLLRAEVQKLTGKSPAIITGDFNATENSPPYEALFAGQPLDGFLVDVYRKKHPQPAADEKTAGGFRRATRSTGRIDWIVCTPQLKILSSQIDRTEKEGRTPSDHDPVNAVLAY